MNKLIFLTAIIPVLMLTVPNLHATDEGSGQGTFHNELTNKEIDILAGCSDDGYEDGQNNPFDHERNQECDDLDKEFGVEVSQSTYYQAFIKGCMDSGNTQEICEGFTDE
jgi:hypothetical protein